MSAAVIVERLAEASPALMASLAAVMYAINIAVGIFSALAAPKASGIVTQGLPLQMSFVTRIVSIAAYAAIVPIFYDLFRPVSKGLSLLAAFIGAAGSAALAVNSLHLFAPLLLLTGAQRLNAFTSEQLQAAAQAFLPLQGGPAHDMSLGLFGLYCLLIAYLIFRSGSLPRILAVLTVIAAIGWVLAPALLRGTSLALWLLIIGVNVSTHRPSQGQ